MDSLINSANFSPYSDTPNSCVTKLKIKLIALTFPSRQIILKALLD